MIRAQLDELGIPFSSGRGAVKAMCNEIGWDSRGRETGKCDLPAILHSWSALHPNGLPTAAELMGNVATETASTIEGQQETPAMHPEAVADNRWGQMAFGF